MKRFGNKTLMKILLLSVISMGFLTSCGNAPSDSSEEARIKAVSANVRAPSQNPPDGLLAEEVPMFVNFDFDDNSKSDGMTWAISMFNGKKNPAGTGNAATYDGTPVTASFNLSAYYVANWISESPTYVKRAWRAAYDAGHEIGNHTLNHGHGSAFSVAEWNAEIDSCNSWITKPFDPNEPNTSPSASNGVGVPASQMFGFRTPFLEYNDNLYTALAGRSWYDCSIEEGFEEDQDGTNYFWPYTLDAGSPGHNVQVEWGSKTPLENHPGIWEMPVYTVIVPPSLRATMKSRVSWFDEASGKITGFDYNLWTLFSMTKAEYLETLKYTLDLRLQGNRAPMMLGAHTEYYLSSYSTPAATYLERQAAMKEFMEYALTKADVRFVSTKKILDWVKYPVSLRSAGERLHNSCDNRRKRNNYSFR